MIPFLEGALLYLRPLADADADGWYPAWFNDPETCAGNSHHVRPFTREEARAYAAISAASTTSLVLAICDRLTRLHVGNVALQNINPVYHSADFAIVIGERYYRGKGYGKEAARLIIDHGFRQMNLHRIACATFANNRGMIELAFALGMKKEGVRISAAYKNGIWLDVVEFGILKDEWRTAFP